MGRRVIEKKKKQNKDKQIQNIGIAWYRSEQWQQLRQISIDADQLEETYEEWHNFAIQKIDELKRIGIEVEKVEVDVNELLSWCKARRLRVNGESRSEFVAEKMQHQNMSE